MNIKLCLDALLILGSSASSPSIPSATSGKESPKATHKGAPPPLYELASSEPLEHHGNNTVNSTTAAISTGSTAATLPSIETSKIKSILHHSKGVVVPEAAGIALDSSATSPSKTHHSEHVRFDTAPLVNPSPPPLQNPGSPRCATHSASD
jgi:hypothetical protein